MPSAIFARLTGRDREPLIRVDEFWAVIGRRGGKSRAIAVLAVYVGEPGVSFYTHVSDQFSPYHTKVIAATASEAPHVLDGLLNHQSGLRIEEHYTDTGGATDHVFGLCHVLGFRFAPRMRDIKDRRLHVFPGSNAPPILARLVGGFVDADHGFGRGALLWLLGIPIPVIILLALFWHH